MFRCKIATVRVANLAREKLTAKQTHSIVLLRRDPPIGSTGMSEARSPHGVRDFARAKVLVELFYEELPHYVSALLRFLARDPHSFSRLDAGYLAPRPVYKLNVPLIGKIRAREILQQAHRRP